MDSSSTWYKLSLKKDVDDAGEDAKPEPKKKEKHRHRDGGRGRGSRGGAEAEAGGDAVEVAKMRRNRNNQRKSVREWTHESCRRCSLVSIARSHVMSEKVDALIDRISPALFTIAHSPNLGGVPKR